jgi:hypothetical protein
MITIQINGGLGNQLFQVFATLAAAIRNNDACYFLHTQRDATGKRATYWKSLLYSLIPITVIPTQANVTQFMQLPVHRESGFRYAPLPRTTSMNSTPVNLVGYFQSDKYFADVLDEIYAKIQLKNQQDGIKTMFENSAWFSGSVITIAMHFRIGDYAHIQDKHPVLPLEHYRKALQHVVNNVPSSDIYAKTNGETTETFRSTPPNVKFNVLIFNQACDNDIVLDHMRALKADPAFANRCRFYKVPDMFEDWKQLLLMSVCDHNIIANSTFSWWGAYFNHNPGKMVCYPSTWFGPALKHDTRDLFPADWVKINNGVDENVVTRHEPS